MTFTEQDFAAPEQFTESDFADAGPFTEQDFEEGPELAAAPLDFDRLGSSIARDESQRRALSGFYDPGTEFTTAIAEDPLGFAMSPLTITGDVLNAAASDVGASLGTLAAGQPELAGVQGGNLYEYFNKDRIGLLPQEQVLADVAETNPALATTGKIAAGLVKSAPMLALMPQGALGKLVAAGFTADMIHGAGDAATRLGTEMGKPVDERDADALTTALSDIIQSAAFAPLTGAHAGGKVIGERVAPKREVIRELANALKAEPKIPTTLPTREPTTAEFIAGDRAQPVAQELPVKPKETVAVEPLKEAAPPPVETPAERMARIVEEGAAAKEALFKQRAVERTITDEDFQITVNKAGKEYIQVDEITGTRPEDNQMSTNPERLIEAGYKFPTSAELQTLPQGRYTLEQARKRLAEEKPVAEAPAPPTAKEPWEMTRKAWDKYLFDTEGGFQTKPRDIQAVEVRNQAHRQYVESAIKEGKPIPPEVLKDYPDLQSKPAPEASKVYAPEMNVPEAVKIAETAGIRFDGQRPDQWSFTLLDGRRPETSITVKPGASLAEVQAKVEGARKGRGTEAQRSASAKAADQVVEEFLAKQKEGVKPATPAAKPEASGSEAVPGMVELGAATPESFEPAKPFKTSNKNATVDAERKARGLPPMMELERQSNQSAWDEAMKIVDERPEVQDALITELAGNPRAVTTTENALLLQRRVDLRNEYEKALKSWREHFEGDDMVRAAEESLRVKDLSSKLSDLEDITKATGAESGRSLQARKMMAREDYTLATMELKAMEAKGRNLTPEEHIALIKARERIVELETKLADLEGGREAVEVGAATGEALGEISKGVPKETKPKDFDVDREENLLGAIKAKVDKGQQAEITPLVQQLARLFWQRGIRQREPMVDALHETLKTIVPELTREETQRAFSGYGNYKALSKEAIDVGLRDLRGQTQQVLKLDALEARKPLEKTGQERRAPSDDERRLIKQVNELKRKYGVVVTDPATQLKSALQSRKTYYEHRISDLKHEIATRERIVKTKSTSPRDAELDAMIAEKDRLQGEHDSIFGEREITDAQRLKLALTAAERNQAHWETRLENAEKGIFGITRSGKKPVTSAELETIKAQTAAIKEHVQELKDLDGALLEKKRTESLYRQKATLEKQIAEQERKLRDGDLESPGKPMNRPADPVLEELKQKRDALNEKLAEARKKPEAQKYVEAQARELERLNKAINERQAKIAAGDISPSGAARKINRPLPPELEQAKQQLEMVNEQLAALRKAAKPVKTPEQIALQSLKTRMKSRTADYHERLAKGDFVKKERKPVPLDAEAQRLKAELEIAKEGFEHGLAEDRWQRMSVFQKGKRTGVNAYDAARAIMTTGELSFILRQGKGVVLSRPGIAIQALPDTFRALTGSEARVRELENRTLDDPMAETALQDKLHLDRPGARLSKQEESIMGHWVHDIPIVRNFTNAGRVFLNKIRLDTYKALRKSLSKSGTPTPEEGRQIAMFVNETTGRGGLGKAEPAAVVLGRMMFSPRYYVSRLQLASGHSMWGGTMRTRRTIATEYARTLVGLGLYYTMLNAYFSSDDDEEKGDIETDPRSTDFGKVRMGDTRLDPLAGLSQVIVMGARTGTGEKKTTGGKVQPIRGKVPYGGQTWADIAASHLRGKLHPVPGAIANLFDGTDLGGDEATLINQTQNMLAPITYMDIYAALKEQGLDDGAALALLALLGEGLQTYDKKK